MGNVEAALAATGFGPSDGLDTRTVGKDQSMNPLRRRATVAAVASVCIAAAAPLGVGISAAEPLNCVNGQFWDPITNTCQTPRQADNCAPGQYWNALSNVCRPLGQL